MTRTRSTPTSLLASYAADQAARVTATAAAVADAQRQYWLVVDRLASGDESGGIDRASFAAVLEALQVDMSQVTADVATVRRLRTAQQSLVTTEAQWKAATAACGARRVAWHEAKAALDRAEREREQARGIESDFHQEWSRLRLEIRDELRSVESALRARGFVGELLEPLPPPPPRRRWRFTRGSDASCYTRHPVQDGSEVDLPHEFGGLGQDTFGVALTVCLGPVTPEMGPPRQIPWPRVGEGQRFAVEQEV